MRSPGQWNPGERRPSIVAGRFGHAIVHSSDRAFAAHADAHYSLIFKIDGDDARFVCAGRSFVLRDGNCMLLNPWDSHSRWPMQDERNALLLALRIEHGWLRSRLQGSETGQRLFDRHEAAVTPSARALCEEFGRALSGGQPIDDSWAERAVLHLVTEAALGARRSTGARPSARIADSRVRQAMAYVHERIADNLCVGDIAGRVGLSRSNFFEVFKREMGIAPQQYVDSVRMGMVTRMLAASDLPIAHVSDAVGFSAATHFSRFFMRHAGIRPAEFRRRRATLSGALRARVPADLS